MGYQASGAYTAGAVPTITTGQTAGVSTTLQDMGGALNAFMAWTAWTPTLTNFTLGNGTSNCYYTQINKTVWVQAVLNAGSTTLYNASAATISLPAAASASLHQYLPGFVQTGSANLPAMIYIANGATAGQFYVATSSANCTLVAMTNSTTNPGNTTGGFTFSGCYQAS